MLAAKQELKTAKAWLKLAARAEKLYLRTESTWRRSAAKVAKQAMAEAIVTRAQVVPAIVALHLCQKKKENA
jgi:hypothetical protein